MPIRSCLRTYAPKHTCALTLQNTPLESVVITEFSLTIQPLLLACSQAALAALPPQPPEPAGDPPQVHEVPCSLLLACGSRFCISRLIFCCLHEHLPCLRLRLRIRHHRPMERTKSPRRRNMAPIRRYDFFQSWHCSQFAPCMSQDSNHNAHAHAYTQADASVSNAVCNAVHGCNDAGDSPDAAGLALTLSRSFAPAGTRLTVFSRQFSVLS